MSTLYEPMPKSGAEAVIYDVRITRQEKHYIVVEQSRGYLIHYNTRRPHQGRGMNGRTPAAVFASGLPNAKPKKEVKRKTDAPAQTATI